jgi:outer membrane protein TolC
MQVAPAFAEAVSLREAISRALQANHLMKAVAFERGAAQQEVAVSRSRYFPTVYLESGAMLSNTPSKVFMMKLDEARINPQSDFAADSLNHPAARGDFRTAFNLEQPLLDLRIATGVKLAAKDAESAELSLLKTKEAVAFRVYLAYLEVRKAQALRGIADQAVLNAKEHSRLAVLREQDGMGLKSDQLRAATALSEAEQRLVSAINDLLLARLRLNLAVGGREGAALDINETPSVPEPAMLQSDLITLAQKSRPDLQQAEKAVEKGDIAARQALYAYLPSLHAGAGYQINDRDRPFGTDHDSWSVGVTLRWELLDGNRRWHEKGKAELGRKAAAEMLENGRQEVALQVTQSVLRRQEAALQLDSARNGVRAAEEALRLITLRFQNGLSSMVELMDVESALNRSRAKLVEVENGLIASSGDIYYQAGVFLKEIMR